MNEKVQAVIVGSGACGSLLAAKLSQAGKKVMILEGGPERKKTDLYSSQIWARRLKWGGPSSETAGSDPLSIQFGQGWGTGGSAVHHYAVWLRLHPEDFELKSRFGKGMDWPISYQDLRPFYDQIQKEVGISGDAEKEVWRPAGEPYPMPALPIFNQGLIIERGFHKMGLRTSPLPLAINSIEYKGRSACIYDGWCNAGCPIDALANPLTVYLAQALKSGAEIRHHSAVTRVLMNDKGDRVTGVEYYNQNGERNIQHADVVVLAAFALQNPRILLNSRTEKYSHGLANSSGLVGKYFMAHPAGNVFGIFPEETQSFLGVTGGQVLCQEDYAKDPKKEFLASFSWLIANALKPNDLLGVVNSRPDIFGAALHDFLYKAGKYMGTMTFVGEDRAAEENQMVLSDKKDGHGYPLGKFTHSFGPDSIRCYEAGMKQGQAALKAAGATEVWTGPRVCMHTMGGTIMGRDPATSVTNSYGQAHDIYNLFVTGTGLFPTSGAVNPTFTIHALTLRTAKHLIEHWPA